MWTPRQWVAAVVAGALLLTVAFIVVRRYVDLGFEVAEDPLGYATVIDRNRPNIGQPAAMLERLDRISGQPWEGELFQDVHEIRGGEPLAGNRPALRDLAQTFALPDLEQWGIVGVATNARDRASVEANGVFALVWFNTPAKTRDWMERNLPVFADAEVDDERRSYLAGTFALYYAPTGAGDRAADIEELAREIVYCPNDAEPCETP